MNKQQTFVRRFLPAFVLPVMLVANSGRLAAVELRFGNTIERVHPDEVEMVQYCRKAGIGYNLNNQTSNPGGGGIESTDEGRLIVLYFSQQNSLTLEQLKPLSKATHLSNFGCPAWADDNVLGFFTHPGRFPKVTGLSIHGSKITDEGLAGLKNFPLVASLNLDSSSITDRGIQHLSKIPRLSFLRLNATRITDKGVSYLPDLPDLSFLELKTTQITDDGLKHLGRLPKLHTLYLDDTAITGSGLKHLAPLAHLRLLSLNNTCLHDKGLAELVEHPNLAKVEVLYLSSTKITDAGCETFEGLKNLMVLALDKTKVTDKGIRHLKDMPRLYNLSLGSGVTREGWKWLAENARFESALQLQLRQAHLSQEKKPNRSPGTRDPILRPLEGAGEDLVPRLEAGLQHESPQVRLEALGQLERRAAMRSLGPGVTSAMTRKHNSLKLSAAARERVYTMLADSDTNVRRAASIVVVAAEGDLATKAKALAEAACREKDVMTLVAMQEALYCLAEQQPIDSKDLPVLIDGLIAALRKSENTNAPFIALRNLGRLGGKSQPAIGVLRTLANGPEKQLAAAAEEALEQIHRCPITLMRATGVPLDVQNLVFTLTTYDQEAVDRATAELVRRGPGMLEPLLTAARADVDEYYPQKAAAVVGKWKQEDVLPLLRPAFDWKGTSVRLFVIRCISQMQWNELPGVVRDSLEGRRCESPRSHAVRARHTGQEYHRSRFSRTGSAHCHGVEESGIGLAACE